ncbi:DUF1801 domain-containing protein [Candidatus Saccharibacteria bacterium]|nr:MAG: DUF1801 domain-containing protein [Candidatus Saccharibacteria bacterium]
MSKVDVVSQYIAMFPRDTQSRLNAIRSIIIDHAPDAIESISYGMPVYKLNKKPLIYFAGYQNHIGIYATPNGHEEFTKEFSKYKQGKGSVQFPHDQPLPVDLIKKVVQFRVQAIIGG